MAIFSLIQPPWPSGMENNLKIFIAGFSDSSKKLCYLEKLSPNNLLRTRSEERRVDSSYPWNRQVYASLGNSLLVAMTNNTCVKSSMKPQAYKIVSTHSHEISGWTILSRLLHSRAPHLGGMNGGVQSDLVTLDFRNDEQLEYFHSRILRLQQEIMLSGEIVSPTRLLFQYMKALTKIEKHKADACIIRGPKFLLPSLRRKMNQFNALHGQLQIGRRKD